MIPTQSGNMSLAIHSRITRFRCLLQLLACVCGLLAGANFSHADDKADPKGTEGNKSAASVAPAPGVIVIRPASWAKALNEWKAYRKLQGHEIYEVDSELGPKNVIAEIKRLADTDTGSTTKPATGSTTARGPIGYVLILGDGEMGSNRVGTLPPLYRESTAMVKFGGDAVLATDNPYGDIDGDDSPELAVGRVPADSAESAAAYLARAIAYEQALDYGKWRRDVRVVAGVGGFGKIADSVIEMTTSRFLTDRIPAWADVVMTYASPNSPYCPDPYRFSEATLGQLNSGSMFWVYVGHGHIKHLDYLRVNEKYLNILDSKQVSSVEVSQKPPIAIFLACYTGAFDAREDCISEQLLLHPSGPVACLSATRVTGPYGLASLASGMLDECYVQHTESLGLAIMKAKRRMLVPTPTLDSEESKADPQMQLVTAIATALSPGGHDLLAERLEHVWQMNLLGDPLLRLNHPSIVDLQVTPRAAPGETISINGTASQSGKLHVELSMPRDKTAKDLFIAGQFTDDEAIRQKMQATYAVANERIVIAKDIQLEQAGRFACDLTTDEELPAGRYIVRVFIEGQNACSAGSASTLIRAPRK